MNVGFRLRVPTKPRDLELLALNTGELFFQPELTNLTHSVFSR